MNHPNILSIYDVGKHDGSPYVVSELLEGETLRTRISGAPLASRRAIDYALQITHGLADNESYALIRACDGIVTGIQITTPAVDVAA